MPIRHAARRQHPGGLVEARRSGRRAFPIRASLAAVVTLLHLAGAARADDDPEADRARAAELVTIAKLAALLCPDVEADDDALDALMEHADLTEGEVMDPKVFGVQDELVAHSFARSFRDDPPQTCADVVAPLGPDGVHLLRPKLKRPG